MKTQLLTVGEGKQTGETIYFTMIECCNCGVPFMVPERLRKSWKDYQTTFYCPSGHAQSYTKSTAQILKEKLERLESESKETQQRLENKLLDEINARKKLDRKLKRVHNGVCPCCNRTFVNLARHMKTKHPEMQPPTDKIS